ncbi:hypothetical protein CEUSTIGMA_g1271.t1 [Chlamydomonas eustigma]|uniref:ATP-dependent helicase HrpB n=1 Tax=Chlamydomonas eustigma TaxID=1157962 RepID=A0A250WTG7_9CHLO|nr:hypothetical protein CEUSTIGMA_g1271.t1 [Chlamydomonas eustigma]|eukprot:GAX73820.1 hypothetical protein CEUSTIGMA_g1271.t1 [Chlamydomonas eustigma]
MHCNYPQHFKYPVTLPQSILPLTRISSKHHGISCKTSRFTAAANLRRLHFKTPCSPERLAVLPLNQVAAATQQGSANQFLVPASVLEISGDLPIRQCIGDVLHGLDSSSCLVLQAPPGAGKTTVVPLAMHLHNPGYLAPGMKIMVLEPRRVAAKAAARRMAAMLGEEVGQTVGYRVRLESRVGPRTKIEVVTDGILIRMLQQDPGLSAVGAVLFDEFHERNIDSDLALTLCLDSQQLARPDLRLLVMSATLGGGLAERLAALMDSPGGKVKAVNSHDNEEGSKDNAERVASVPIVYSEGRSYPVDVKYLGRPEAGRGALEKAVANTVLMTVQKQQDGDVLVFLPGVGEIRGVDRILSSKLRGSFQVLQLHGNLAPELQDRAIRGGGNTGGHRQRRVILSTPIAESSVTIDGVRVVIDSGLRRSPAYDTKTGVNRLRLTKISAASADQRAGRAGRTGPGTCYRLWEASERLLETTPPEIEEADLAPVCLELALWGNADGMGLPWLDAPSTSRVQTALELLQELGAIDSKKNATEQGRSMARFGVDPRYAHMALKGADIGASELAAVLAALLSERDLLRGTGSAARSADVMLRLQYLQSLIAGQRSLSSNQQVWKSVGESSGSRADQAAATRVLQTAEGIAAQLCRIVEKKKLLEEAKKQGSPADWAVAESASDSESGLSEVAGFSSWDEDGEGMSGVDSLEDEVGAKPSTTARSNQDHRGGGHVGVLAHQHSRDFNEAWTSQMLKECLVGALVAFAYPDRIARRKEISSSGRATFLMADDREASLLISGDPLSTVAEYLAVAELGGSNHAVDRKDVIYLAAPLTNQAITRYLDSLVRECRKAFWASESKTVMGQLQRRLGALVLEKKRISLTDEEALPALVKGFREMGGLEAMGLSNDLRAWRDRVCWLRTSQVKNKTPGEKLLPDLSDAALLKTAHIWLKPYCSGVRSKSDLLKLDWRTILYELVGGWGQARDLEALAPSHIRMPTGTEVLVDYSSREQPVVSVRIQEAFGMLESPKIADGKIPVVMELLSPAGRPLQTTMDLKGFWQNNYNLVLRDMKGRYPRHYWPDDPSCAEPTRLTKKAMDRKSAEESATACSAKQTDAHINQTKKAKSKRK